MTNTTNTPEIPDAAPCKKCGRKDGLNFTVPDDVWRAVVGREEMWCLWCFDAEAHRKEIKYDPPQLDFAGVASNYYSPHPRMVRVIWEDSVGYAQSWEHAEEHKPQLPAKAMTLGYLIDDHPDFLVVAGTFAPNEPRQHTGRITIPRGCIAAIESIDPDARETTSEIIEAARHVFQQCSGIATSGEAPVIQDWGKIDRLGAALKAYDNL